MASALAEKLNQCALKITTANSESNAASSFGAWFSLHQLLQEYFLVSAGEEQSEEVKESQEKFDWNWPELPDFPLRRLMPSAAKTLVQFPDETAHAMLIADFCSEACKQNVLAKMAAMESGLIQGLCRTAGRFAAVIRNLVLQNGPPLEFAELLIDRIFEALHYITESPTMGFYSKTLEVKQEFYSQAAQAWGQVDLQESTSLFNEHLHLPGLEDVNHALALTVFYLKQMPDAESNKNYLSVLRNIAEPWDFKFPTHNRAFLKCMKLLLRRPERESSSSRGKDALLLAELLVILKRTADPEAVPYDHRLPYFTPALSRFVNKKNRVEGPDNVRLWNMLRETVVRRKVQDQALSIRVTQQQSIARQRARRVAHAFVNGGAEATGRLQTEETSTSQEGEKQANSEASSSTAAENQHIDLGGTSKGAGAKGELERAAERSAGSSGDDKRESQQEALLANVDFRNETKGERGPQKEAPKETEGAGVTQRTAAASQNEAEGSHTEADSLRAEIEKLKADIERHRTEAANIMREAEEIRKEAADHREEPESASRESVSNERGGERMCGWCAKTQKDRAPGASKFKKCARCEGVFYCNAECQKLHWSQHKRACVRP